MAGKINYMCIAADLQQQVRKHKLATGEDTLLVVIENSDKTLGIHQIAFDPYIGLMVDGRSPKAAWYQSTEAFHALETEPRVLH